MSRIVLGLGNTVDYELQWDSGVLERLILEYGIRSDEIRDFDSVHSEREMILSVLHFFRDSTGGERFVADPSVIRQFAGRFRTKTALGGTPVRAALAMEKVGCSAFLHLTVMDEWVRRLLPAGCGYVCSADKENSTPHLILQFYPGSRIKAGEIDLTALRANRLIYDNDRENMEMKLNRALEKELRDAEVFLVSGFNAVRDRALLEERMDELLDMMKCLPEQSVIFYEDGCFHFPEYTGVIWEKLLDEITVYSMNEDELQAYAKRTLRLDNPEEIYAALIELRKMIPAKTLLIHTGAWVLAYGENPQRWRNAIGGGIAMAATRYRKGDGFTAEDYRETEHLPLQEAGKRFAAGIGKLAGENVCCLPCIQAKVKNPVTIGLGDSFVGGFLAAWVRDGER